MVVKVSEDKLTDPVRRLVYQRLQELDLNFKAASEALPAAQTYFQQFLQYHKPAIITEQMRPRVARVLQVDEEDLKMPSDNLSPLSTGDEQPEDEYFVAKQRKGATLHGKQGGGDAMINKRANMLVKMLSQEFSPEDVMRILSRALVINDELPPEPSYSPRTEAKA
jgi:hypothetical protein